MRKSTTKDLDRLDDFLCGLDDDAMLLSTLDGFLSGIVVCPELVLPSEWLPYIWGEGAAFTDQDEANEILDLVKARYNEIIHSLGRKGKYEPIFEFDTDDGVLWEIWAEGFAAAMALRPGSWDVYDAADDAAVKSSVRCLVGLASYAIDGKTLPAEVADEVRDSAHNLIADCLETLNAARLAMEPSVPKGAARVGRNDPCPCGSGKKFKKCCLS